MIRMLAGLIVFAMGAGAGAGGTEAADLKPIHAQKTRDAMITLKNESGQWRQGPNAFVLEITSPDGKPLDAGKATLSTSMSMPGMAPMIAGATLSPDKAPGRYTGTINFPDGGTRQVTVTWAGPGSKGSAKFPVPVR